VIFWDAHLSDDERGALITREDAVALAASKITAMGFHVLGDPASNKWLTVWQFLNQALLMLAFGRLFVGAWRRASDLQAGEEADYVSGMSEDEKIGIMTSATWHRFERRRDLKALGWIEQ